MEIFVFEPEWQLGPDTYYVLAETQEEAHNAVRAQCGGSAGEWGNVDYIYTDDDAQNDYNVKAGERMFIITRYGPGQVITSPNC